MTNKLSNVFNIESIKTLDSALQSFGDVAFKDAPQGNLLNRQFLRLDPQIFEAKYPENTYLNSGITIDNSGGAATFIQSLRRNRSGQFKLAGDLDAAKGLISYEHEVSGVQVFDYSAESKWTDQDVRRAAMANLTNPVNEFLRIHNELYQQHIDISVATGLRDLTGATGLLNYANFTDVTAPIAPTTGKELYAAIISIIARQQSKANGILQFMPTHVIFPIDVMTACENTVYDSNGTNPDTVLAVLQRNYPNITFLQSVRNNTGGVGGASVIIVYSANSENMKIRIPQPLRFAPQNQVGFTFTVESQFSIAGIDILDNNAATRMLNLDVSAFVPAAS